MTLTIGMLLVVVGLLGALSSYLYAMEREGLKKRLQSVSVNSLAPVSRTKWTWKSDRKRREKLVMLGYSNPQAETIFMLLRSVAMLLGAAAWFIYQQLTVNAEGVANAVASAIIVGMLVDRVLNWRVNQIRQDIVRSLPDALDLMVVCVSSGQSIESTFRTVGEEMKSISPALSREWLLTATEMSVLDSPHLALRHLDNRLSLTEVNNMIITMSQALKFGTPMAEALKLIASDNRQYQLLELEEWVGKIPTKMSFPLVVLIMLPVVVIIVAPTVLMLFETLGQL